MFTRMCTCTVFFQTVVLIAILLCSANLSFAKERAFEDANLSHLLAKSLAPAKSAPKKTGRMEAIIETARTLGFQEAMRVRYERFFLAAVKRRAEFAKIFDFQRLLLDGRVLPPVIRWSGPATTLESETCATEVSAQYHILSQARLVSRPPSFEDYLFANTTVLEPSAEIRPRNREEKALWKQALTEGYQEGFLEAKEVFDLAFAKLLLDYRGILRFRELARRGLVSVPVLATGSLGLQVGENVLSMDQKILRITVPASFQKAEQLQSKVRP